MLCYSLPLKGKHTRARASTHKKPSLKCMFHLQQTHEISLQLLTPLSHLSLSPPLTIIKVNDILHLTKPNGLLGHHLYEFSGVFGIVAYSLILKALSSLRVWIITFFLFSFTSLDAPFQFILQDSLFLLNF